MKKIFWIFRLSILLLLIFLAMKPVAVRPESGMPERWAFLVDSSASMRVKDPIERLGRVKKTLVPFLKSVGRANFFHFSDDTRPLQTGDLEKLNASGLKTDLAQALKRSFSDAGFRGAVVLSDGREVGSGADALSVAASLGRPLLLVGVGDRSLFKDVAVRSIQSPPFAFKNVATSLSAALAVTGYAGQEIVVSLKEGDRLLSLQKVRAAGPDMEVTVTFNWTPTRVGTRLLAVEADRYAGEATAVNNRKEVTMDVGRDRFRVLYICGQPGPEYGFLRHQFKSDPAVELVTFVILRNATNVVNIPEGELSLIPFPTPDVLISQMATFDLVVFEEFAYQQYGLGPQVLYAIRQKVQDGGSFLMMGGPLVFGAESGYALPGIREMIPVEFGGGDVGWFAETFPFIPKALSHPILRLEENSDQNKAVWASLPPLDGLTLLSGPKPGATVLASAQIKGREVPVLTVWKYGKGRVAAMGTRTTWRWSMVSGSKQQLSDAYQRFWKNMVLWLTHADEFKPVRVAFENKVVRVQEKQALRVWVVDDYFKPVSDVDVQVQVENPDGSKDLFKPDPETSGVFSAPFVARQIGRHQIKAWVLRLGKKFGEDSLSVRVAENHFEEEDLRPDFDFLKELAHATDGKFVTIDQFSPALFAEFNRAVSSGSGKKVLIWNSPFFLAALLTLLVVEWVLRRRKGLP